MSEFRKQRMSLIQFFTYKHLKEELRATSQLFAELAEKIEQLPENCERTTALRKLLEAKDCAVRALLYKKIDDENIYEGW